ncbi:MAG: DUF4302 domain-containing protein [Bacteroidales bacterium]|nr:DUF4302 domain-containing protein [Bacteroidales bacterium]
MKIRNIISAFAAIALMFPMQSCLKDTTEVFEESPSSRLESYNDGVHKILCDGDGTWIMEYYPGANRMYGGYTFVLDFAEKEVTVKSELTDKAATSLYKFTADNGPVISFDTYNEVLHYFATPSSSKYEAYGGDFEFSIITFNDDEVIMRGKRTGNRYKLVRAPEGFNADEYLAGINALKSTFKAPSVEGKIGDLDVTGSINLTNRTLHIYYPTGEVDEDGEDILVDNIMQFTITPEGFHMYAPLEINGYTIRDLFYLSNYNSVTNGVFTLKGKRPAGYKEYDELPGTYKIVWSNGSADVTLKETENRDGFIMTGFVKGKDVWVGYDEANGSMSIVYQTLGSDGGLTVRLCPWDTEQGYLTKTEGCGVNIKYDEASKTFKFSDNGMWEGYKIDSFIIYSFNSADAFNDEYTGYGNSRFVRLSSMTKIN